MKKGITLLGMPGSGKSSVGKHLSVKLNWRHLDLDEYIRDKQKVPHYKILAEKGEEALLALENQYTLELDLCNTVFSPGGSIVYSPLAMEKIRKDTLIILLEAPLEEVKKRVGPNLDNKRGIVGWYSKGMDGLLEERIPLMRAVSHLTIPSFDYSPAEAADVIIKLLQKHS